MYNVSTVKGNGQAAKAGRENTMKYNKSEIFRNAWATYRMAQKWVQKLSFGECLRRAWAKAKETVATAKKIARGTVQIMFDSCATLVVNLYHRTVEGNTYRYRKELKSFGLTWDPHERVWEGTTEQLTRLCEIYG